MAFDKHLSRKNWRVLQDGKCAPQLEGFQKKNPEYHFSLI